MISRRHVAAVLLIRLGALSTGQVAPSLEALPDSVAQGISLGHSTSAAGIGHSGVLPPTRSCPFASHVVGSPRFLRLSRTLSHHRIHNQTIGRRSERGQREVGGQIRTTESVGDHLQDESRETTPRVLSQRQSKSERERERESRKAIEQIGRNALQGSLQSDRIAA